MSELQEVLSEFRTAAQSQREKGTYFEELTMQYLRYEPRFQNQYSAVWPYAEWAQGEGQAYTTDARDEGIDLVARTRGNNEYHAIQCKFYALEHSIQKTDIDSFFTASGQAPFTARLIVASTDNWSQPARNALHSQQIPVTLIDLEELENSQIDWARYRLDRAVEQAPVLKARKAIRAHQQAALERVRAGFATAARGKMIMACGTGKTFTSLRIAEDHTIAGPGKRVLFMVPSLALLSQALTEWTQESETPLYSFAVCSDVHVGKQRKQSDDRVETYAHELSFPTTTAADKLATNMAALHDEAHISVVFSTYHSIDVIHRAQKHHGMPAFDLMICDEAHRTTGAVFEGEDESQFVRIHHDANVEGRKRLYMTATPRIYGDVSKSKAEQGDFTLCSMDDPALYGEEWYVLGFSEAVSKKLLVDYKVIVLAIDEAHVSRRLQRMLADEQKQLRIDDAAKIVGCWKALSKSGLQGAEDDSAPMQRAVAFCQVIEHQSGKKIHKVSSKHIASVFQAVVQEYQREEPGTDNLMCEVVHVDGTMNATEKKRHLDWLKNDMGEREVRLLTNVRVLSEGVDVPALDAVLFLTPRNSQVDIVQSVGRVMRLAPGKKRGYVILPVVIPAGIDARTALNDNKTYKVVWQVLQALRSHDDHFDAMINKLDLSGHDGGKMEVIAVTEQVTRREAKPKPRPGSGKSTIGRPEESGFPAPTPQIELALHVGEVERAIYAKVVQKCGNRLYWDEWATDIANIARTHITRISTIVQNPENTTEAAAFQAFAEELRDDLNDSITDEEVIEMLAQHLITRPVFEALFEGAEFVSRNPVSIAMQGVLDGLQEHHLETEAETLEQFYDSVRMRASGIDNIEGKQRIVVELYDKFFRNAFPRMTERLGIVYTPVEVVDFIIHSVNDLLRQEFGQTLGSQGVHIVDPFAGTGTFITRLLQSGLIKPEEMSHKYRHEIHANEIVLLAYYIAAINIEAVYHSLTKGEYMRFEGICLTDTFQMYESEDLLDTLLPVNSKRRKRQKALRDIRVIMANPPYSAGQRSENDDAQNVAYPSLDKRIEETYARYSGATLKRNLYDSYIRAIRWGSDRLGDAGVMAYVSGSAWIERSFADGLRQCLAEEFTNLYVFHLRGDIRKNMLSGGAAKEGGNIFGSASMTGISIAFFVKNPEATQHGQIYFHDIGDSLNREDKLRIINEFHSVGGITEKDGWRKITPDVNHDWLNQENPEFNKFIALGDKKGISPVKIFDNFSLGVATGRDAWCYNASRKVLGHNIHSMINCYNAERERYQQIADNNHIDIGKFVNNDSTRISWTHALKQDVAQNKDLFFTAGETLISDYRPFSKRWMYYGRRLNERVYQMPQIFPNATAENRVICATGRGARTGFSALMVDKIPNLDTLDKGQCFPLNLYTKAGPHALLSKDIVNEEYQVRDGITNTALQLFQAAYPGETLRKDDLFYYIYGLLHSPDYREKYRNNLMKQLPRVPAVSTWNDFCDFRDAGRALTRLHLQYDDLAPWPVTVHYSQKQPTDINPERLYRVTKMKFGGTSKLKDQTTIIYNPYITVSDIPLEAYDYVVNGKPAVQWVMERSGVRTSGLTKTAVSSTMPTNSRSKP